MTRASLMALVSVLLASLSPQLARAWSCGNLGCPRWCESPSYRIGRVCSALEGEAAGTSIAEIERAMHDWSLVSCTGLESTYAGQSGSAAMLGNGVSEVDFVEQNWVYDANIIGATTWVIESGCIVESDIVLNARNYTFVTQPGFQGEVNAYSALLHEGGHFYGLGHSQFSTTAMYFRYGIGVLEIKYDDEQGLCFLYPGSDPPPDCATTGCPSGQMCSAGTCVDAPTPACMNDHDCPSIQLCNTATGRCENRPIGGSELGTPCDADTDCTSGLCQPTSDGPICSQTCNANDPRSCPSVPTPFYCSGQAVGDCATGVCLPGGGGIGSFGSPCDEATDCASLFCGNGACSVPCTRGVSGTCPAAYACHPSIVGACGVCGAPTPIGGVCQASEECASHLCFDDDLNGTGFCTQRCDGAATCPSAYRCLSVGTDALCAPTGTLHGGVTCGVAGAVGTAVPGTSVFAWAVSLLCVTLGMARATKRR